MNHPRTMRAPWACAVALCCAAATLISTTAFVGCSGEPSNQLDSAASETQVFALGLTSAAVTTVAVTVTGGPKGAGTTTFNLTKNADGNWTGLVSGLPVGTGYVFTMTAKDASGTVLYSGAASSVSIVKGQTSAVMIIGQQSVAPAAFANAPPVIDSLLVSAVKVVPGASIALVAKAHDPNPGDTISYAWTGGGGGVFSASSSNVTNWTAPATAGTYSLLLTVRDQTGANVTTQVSIAVNANNGTGAADVIGSMNTWPVVTNVTGTPNYLVKGTQTLLTVIAADADSDPVTYAWRSNCSGTFTNTQLPTPSFVLDNAATNTDCTFTVAVADNRGGSTTGALTLPVGKPTALIAPSIDKTIQSTEIVGASDAVSLAVNATDPQGLALTFAWTATDGSLGTPTTTTSSSQVVWTPPASAASSWTVTATVTDSAGASAVKTFSIKPSSCFGVTLPATTAWSMGVMADTQWTSADDGKNPRTDAIDITNQLNAQFIAKGVKFVIQVGDLTDDGSNAALDMRAEFAQALYNAGIGYFPLRGNHESSTAGAAEFKRVFPQTLGGSQNATPANAFIPNPDDVNTLPPAVFGSPFLLGSNFSQPSSVITGVGAWDGLSYSFDFGNARIVLLDQFAKPDGTSASGNNQLAPQQAWIVNTLAAKPTDGHAFVFSHKGLITENHTDTLFGSNPSVDPVNQDAFITSLANNGVRYLIMGHDHMHNRAIVTTTDGTTARVQNVTCSSDSSKFYTPVNPSNDTKYDLTAFGHTRETPIVQELYTIGYYVVTVDGSKATVDFYSAAANTTDTITTTPQLNFTKRESFGYGLNGKQFVIPQGASYSVVQDTFGTTTAQILGGTNTNTNLEGSGRNPSKTVDTGWAAGTCATSSAILSLWTTVNALGSDQTDAYALSMSFDPTGITPDQLASGTFGLAVKSANGSWVNAVNKDFGGTKAFVQRAWLPSDALGTYGVDPATNTAWAVINHSSEFAVAPFSN